MGKLLMQLLNLILYLECLIVGNSNLCLFGDLNILIFLIFVMDAESCRLFLGWWIWDDSLMIDHIILWYFFSRRHTSWWKWFTCCIFSLTVFDYVVIKTFINQRRLFLNITFSISLILLTMCIWICSFILFLYHFLKCAFKFSLCLFSIFLLIYFLVCRIMELSFFGNSFILNWFCWLRSLFWCT